MKAGNLADSHALNTSNDSCLAWLSVFPTVSGWPHFFCAKNLPFPSTYAWLWDWEMLRTVFNSCNWISATCVLQGRSSNLLECSVGFNWPWFILIVHRHHCTQNGVVGNIFCTVWLCCANWHLVCLNVCGNSCVGLCFTGTDCDVHNTQSLPFPSGQLLLRSYMLSGHCPESL